MSAARAAIRGKPQVIFHSMWDKMYDLYLYLFTYNKSSILMINDLHFFLQTTRRGSLLSTAIFVYAATSPVNGYFGGGLYARMGGELVFYIKHFILLKLLIYTYT